MTICTLLSLPSALQVENPVKVYVQLLRPSDKNTSEPRPFHYLPLDSGRPFTSFKRLKNNYGLFQRILGLDSPVAAAGSGEDTLRHKTPTPSPRSPTSLEVTSIDIKPKPSTNMKLIDLTPGKSQPHPPPSGSPPLASISNPIAVPTSMPEVLSATSPLLNTSDQSVDDIRQRLTATLERRKVAGGGSPRLANPARPSQFWSDDASVYSDTDMLDEVLSQGSVNDLLSAVGEGLAVYEDLTNLGEPTPSQLIDPDAVYGDASYASCYSNLEFVMGQAKVKDPPPTLPPKKNIRGPITVLEDDYGEYGTPSGQPIHPNKATLLLERGFRVGTEVSSSRGVDSATYYDHNGRGNGQKCDQLEDLWDDVSGQPQEVSCDQLPRTVLDLFV